MTLPKRAIRLQKMKYNVVLLVPRTELHRPALHHGAIQPQKAHLIAANEGAHDQGQPRRRFSKNKNPAFNEGGVLDRGV